MKITKNKIKLSDLLQDVVNVDSEQDCLVSGIALDSRTMQAGDLFLACKGSEVDGRAFIDAAISKEACAILCEDSLPESVKLPKELPVIIVPDLRRKLGFIGARFYNYPARKLTMIGVTGTNGKTSVAQYIATIASHLGVRCEAIGTISGGPNTTPDPITLHCLLDELIDSGVKAVAMEVSSQGLVQGRVVGIDFDIAIFTNLTHEHLDYHGTMKDYGDAKKILFLQNKIKHAVINADDEFGRKLIEELKELYDVYAYAIADKSLVDVPMIKARNIEPQPKGVQALVSSPWGEGLLQSKLLGEFNLSNLLAVIGVLGIMKFKLEDILAKVKELVPVVGRMEVFGGNHKKPLVVIDYAHTPDALEKALTSLRQYCLGTLWCVFGCGGGRDRDKRSLMGKVAERFSDHVVITSDNPRTEDSVQIVDDILQGFLCPWAVEVEDDRGVAIEYAINNAKENDLILIAGKGHEDYQIIGEERLPFSDQEVVKRVLRV